MPYDKTALLDAVAEHFGYPLPFAHAFFAEWARGENTDAAYNPLATTQAIDGSTAFNDAGVQDYASFDDGVQATVLTLDPRSYGGVDYYPTVRRVLQNGVIDAAQRATLAQEIAAWGTTPFADEIRAGWNPTIADPTPADATDPATPTDTPPVSPLPLPGYVTMEEFDAWREHFNDAVLSRLAAVQHGAFDAAANPATIPAYSYTTGIDAFADVLARLTALESPAPPAAPLAEPIIDATTPPVVASEIPDPREN